VAADSAVSDPVAQTELQGELFMTRVRAVVLLLMGAADAAFIHWVSFTTGGVVLAGALITLGLVGVLFPRRFAEVRISRRHGRS
jgi:hypothetical protein